ncbi:DUF1996 domain-containing protein [Andreprevotia chitinilytica]|uniref:DUF1996 domain-containing protein n=1 Tax=Andreprevotia chitinilytica TaxID=396808 RepID=UPI000691189D|nr:DUF1996 domain-containing protein [Andreprevotia chitinilytica]
MPPPTVIAGKPQLDSAGKLLTGAALDTGGKLKAAIATGGQFNVECRYSHTLPDDAIFLFGKPGHSMIHDFFGSVTADANVTFDSLRAQPNITCDVPADRSSYWAPALRRADGEIIRPYAQKTYYNSSPNYPEYPVHPFPAGFRSITGNHMGSAPDPNGLITFGCLGYPGSWGTAKMNACPIKVGQRNTFAISLLFPNCWDGKNLSPTKDHNNVAWAGDDACPAAYPVRIPRLWMQLWYDIGENGDLNGAQLSLDPQMIDGKPVERWGSMYTAHADFYNGWSPRGMQYAVEYCLNHGRSCNKDIPVDYQLADRDTFVNVAEPITAHGSENRGEARDLSSDRRIGLIHFPLNDRLSPSDYSNILVRLYGAGTENGNLFLRSAPDNWSESSTSWNNQPTCGASNLAAIYTGTNEQYRSADVTALVKQALADGKKEISFCVVGPGGGMSGARYWFDTRETANPPMLFYK